MPRLSGIVGDEWFAPLTTLRTDIVTFDFERLLHQYNRIFVFWDAHGYDVAESVLGRLLPDLTDRAHIVAMHDLSDGRYLGPDYTSYSSALWRGNDWTGPRIRLGHIDSNVEQAVAIVDFASRNGLPLRSVDYSFDRDLSADQKKELRRLLGDDFACSLGHWFWFSLNEAKGAVSFPKVRSAAGSREAEVLSVPRRLRAATRILLKGR